MFIFGAVLLVIGVVVVLGARTRKAPGERSLPQIGGWLATLTGVGLLLGGCMYTQDVGQTVVQRSITGEIVGATVQPGLHLKAPWVQTLPYDVRNNTITYVGAGTDNNSGGSATGPQVTFQDKEGVSANLDIVVRYSIVPTAAESIYARYGTQESFVAQVITNDVRTVSRNVPAGFGTIELLNDRAAAGEKIREALAERWEDDGIIVEAVNLQEIRYPQAVTDRFAEAQNSRIEVDRAQADQDRARVEAETRVIAAQGEADANRILSESLTPEVLQQRYIEALNTSGTVFVVPEGSQPLVNTGTPSVP